MHLVDLYGIYPQKRLHLPNHQRGEVKRFDIL
jgi:hypothetical protein